MSLRKTQKRNQVIQFCIESRYLCLAVVQMSKYCFQWLTKPPTKSNPYKTYTYCLSKLIVCLIHAPTAIRRRYTHSGVCVSFVVFWEYNYWSTTCKDTWVLGNNRHRDVFPCQQGCKLNRPSVQQEVHY